jgi:poly(3-hydroxyalkanoate) synthetase
MLIDIGYVIFRHPDIDAYVVGGINDHITPWKGALLLHPPSRRPPGPAKHPSRTGFSC